MDQAICVLDSAYMQDTIDYSYCKPIKKYISLVNQLYKTNKIVIFTTRKETTGNSCKELTEIQLKKWGVKYHQLRFDKSHYDSMMGFPSVSNFNSFLKYADNNLR